MSREAPGWALSSHPLRSRAAPQSAAKARDGTFATEARRALRAGKGPRFASIDRPALSNNLEGALPTLVLYAPYQHRVGPKRPIVLGRIDMLR